MSRAISRRLLVHAVELSTNEGSDSWGQIIYSEPVTIKFVRVEYIKKTVLNSTGDSQEDRLLLFIDKKHSTPVTAFTKMDKITFNSEEFTIREVGLIYGDSKEVHHLEIKLI